LQVAFNAFVFPLPRQPISHAMAADSLERCNLECKDSRSPRQNWATLGRALFRLSWADTAKWVTEVLAMRQRRENATKTCLAPQGAQRSSPKGSAAVPLSSFRSARIRRSACRVADSERKQWNLFGAGPYKGHRTNLGVRLIVWVGSQFAPLDRGVSVSVAGLVLIKLVYSDGV
jgi:hypothetical protein